MTLHPITPAQPACFGVCCPVHGRCTRYAAVDGAPASLPIIATCERDAERPLFIDQRAEQEVPA